MGNEKPANQKIAYIKPEQEKSKNIKKTDVLNPYYRLVISLSQLLSITRLYEFEHKMFKEKLNEVFAEVSNFLSEKQSLSFFESEGNLLVNRQQLEIKDRLTKRLVNSLRDLDAGYLILESGLTLEEFIIFIHLLRNEASLKGIEKVKQYLEEKSAQHIVVRTATYKIIEEDEKVVKKDDSLAVEELSFEIRNRFLEDLKSGEVGKQLVKEEQRYRLLAHDPQFLSKAVFDMVKDKGSPEELARVLWVIGDYLIGEIDSFKAEKINRKAIEELKKKIFALWGQTLSKGEMEKYVQKTFAAITLALELRGLVSLYERHKKNLTKAESKIRKIMSVLPTQGNLYQKTKERLDKIGLLITPIEKYK